MQVLAFSCAAVIASESITHRLVSGLDWAGRVAVAGAILGFVLGWGLRRLGYRRVRRVSGYSELLPLNPLDFSGYWGLTGIVIGFILGVIRG
jgi:hypothetical protein